METTPLIRPTRDGCPKPASDGREHPLQDLASDGHQAPFGYHKTHRHASDAEDTKNARRAKGFWDLPLFEFLSEDCPLHKGILM
jgi:hypothetical protein